jgi:putative DNA methylase
LGTEIVETFDEFQRGRELYLSRGDSAKTDLATESVDAVITDPPFFDNVHYSQLADFFYVWQRHLLGANGNHNAKSTRSENEVQQSDPAIFTERLYMVYGKNATGFSDVRGFSYSPTIILETKGGGQC